VKALDNKAITTLVAKKKRKPASKRGLVKTPTGKAEWVTMSSLADVGRFQGKTGSVYRNRKGQARRRPNGYVTYLGGEWKYGPDGTVRPNVIAYRVGSKFLAKSR
jgi:hypothetical protein